MNIQEHWEHIYATRSPDLRSWFSPHLDASLDLIERLPISHNATIIDVGGGESTFVDDLLRRGYENLTVLDISRTAMNSSAKRLGNVARRVRWITADITQVQLQRAQFDVWHDRAVFHFLTSSHERTAYVQQVARAVKRGGHVIVGVFGPDGPTRCSGLDVVRYDAESLRHEFGPQFRPIESSIQLHRTPAGVIQQFLYCHLKFE
ncbi:MAG TPA: class I SAM-dependent methyltransferase [Terracidiphilus sp.]|nr:class I SAM-dependent methyltransferase [Terracidiphilus sp.]